MSSQPACAGSMLLSRAINVRASTTSIYQVWLTRPELITRGLAFIWPGKSPANDKQCSERAVYILTAECDSSDADISTVPSFCY